MSTNSLASIMDAVWVTTKDAVRIKLIPYINTGDKPLDGALAALVLLIITVISGHLSFVKLHKWYLSCTYNSFLKKNKLTAKTMNKYSEYLNGSEVLTYVDIRDYAESINDKIYHYLQNSPLSGKTITFPRKYSVKNVQNANDEIKALGTQIPSAIFADNNGIVGLCKSDTTYILAHNDQTTFNEFLNEINKVPIIEQKKPDIPQQVAHTNDRKRCIFDSNGKISEIDPDKKLSNVISRHMETISNLLTRFKIINSLDEQYKNHPCRLNGHAIKNLGILLSGVPGSGKSSICSAIANALGRDIYLVNSSNLTTKKAFTQVFLTYSRSVIVFEEFDILLKSLQMNSKRRMVKQSTSDDIEYNVIDTDTVEAKMQDDSQDVQVLKARRRELMLRLSEKNLGGDATVNGQTLKVTKEQIEAELKDINDSIADLSNRLDMRVFLDVLNGTSSPVTSDRVILATTNITNMDASIIRPGRFDVLLEFDYSNSKEIADLLCSIYKNNPKLSPEEFEDIKKTDFQAKRLTPAMIIGAAHILEPYQLIEICKQNDDFRDKYIDIHYYNDLVKRKSTKPK